MQDVLEALSNNQSLIIHQMTLMHKNNQYTLEIIAQGDENNLRIVFDNVSSFFVKQIYTPLSIGGFQVIDRIDMGWSSDVRYQIRDYEDNALGFFCEDILVYSDS